MAPPGASRAMKALNAISGTMSPASNPRMIWATPKITRPVPRSRYAGATGVGVSGSGGVAAVETTGMAVGGGGGAGSGVGSGSGGSAVSTKPPRRKGYLSRLVAIMNDEVHTPAAAPKYFRFRSVYNVVLLPSWFWNLLRRPMKLLDIALAIAVDGALCADWR